MKRMVATILALLLVAAVIVLLNRTRSATPVISPAMSAGQTSRSTAVDTRAPAGTTTGAAPFAERSTLADNLNSPTSNIRTDLQIVAEVLDAFRTNFPRDGNPVGTNAEITAALTGRNRLKLALVPPDHPAIDRDGELCDRWGTPFFFHAESATRMEIRSAGPDRKMWNEDDIVFAP